MPDQAEAGSALRPLDAMLREAASRFPGHDAIRFAGRGWTYAALDRLVDQAAAGLQSLGAVRGTRIGLCLPNTPYAVIFFFAALRLGAVVVNFNPLYVERELAHQIADSGTEIMVTIDLALVLPKLLAVAANTDLRLVVCPICGALPPGKSLLFRLFRRRDLARAPASDRIVSYAALMRRGDCPMPVAVSPVAPGDLAVLQYTGGTTGIPKAAELTHANLVANCEQVVSGMRDLREGAERVLGVLPLFHVFAMTSVMNLAVRTAATMILMPRFALPDLLRTIASERPTVFPAVPTIYAALVEEASRRRVDLRSIRLCVSGGAPLPTETRQRFMALTGCDLMEGYGLSETSPVVSFTPPDMPYKEGSAGVAVPGTTIEIRSPEPPHALLPAGERGEICIRGPQVMRGYWQRPDETAQSFVEGALRTGDIGYLDADGYLFLVDRIKDIIIAGGYNIYPRVIEEALYQHPEVKEAVVIGVPDRYRGQAPKAFVTLREGGAATAEVLRAFLGDYLSKIELPREIEIRETLPKTLIGKLSKKALLEEASGGPGALPPAPPLGPEAPDPFT